MWQEIAGGDLPAVLDCNAQKLVVVAFLDDPPMPLGEIQAWLESLPWKHPNAVFLSITSDTKHKTLTHTTFLFFLKQREAARIVGANRSELCAALKKLDRTTFCRDMLFEMGFPISKVTAAMAAVRNDSVDDCVLYLEQIQQAETAAVEASSKKLISMGFESSIVQRTIEKMGSASFEAYREAVERLSTFENPADGKSEQFERLKATLAQHRPQGQPMEPISPPHEARRKKSQDEMRAQVKIAEAQAQKAQAITDLPFATSMPSGPPPPTGAGGCTLKLIFENGNTIFQHFGVNDTFEAVYQYVISVVPSARNRKIVFETSMPKQVIGEDLFGESLASSMLVPRGQLIVKYVS
jgi:hypothetical protein